MTPRPGTCRSGHVAHIHGRDSFWPKISKLIRMQTYAKSVIEHGSAKTASSEVRVYSSVIEHEVRLSARVHRARAQHTLESASTPVVRAMKTVEIARRFEEKVVETKTMGSLVKLKTAGFFNKKANIEVARFRQKRGQRRAPPQRGAVRTQDRVHSRPCVFGRSTTYSFILINLHQRTGPLESEG